MIVDYDKETDTVYISKQIDNRWIQVGLNRDEVNQIVRSHPYNPQVERELLEKIENFACACVWSDAPDCPGASNGEIICDGCEYFEYAHPEDLRNYIKERMAELRQSKDGE